MFIYIPGWVISLVTFPGVVVHEIAHRFFCDVMGVPVLAIKYFVPFEDTVGCVVHLPATNFRSAFFISAGPLIINSIVCMLCTIPAATSYLLESGSVVSHSNSLLLAKNLLLWVGASAGFHAIPSNQDMSGIEEHAQSGRQKGIYHLLDAFVCLANISYVGSFVRIGFAFLLAIIIPMVFIL